MGQKKFQKYGYDLFPFYQNYFRVAGLQLLSYSILDSNINMDSRKFFFLLLILNIISICDAEFDEGHGETFFRSKEHEEKVIKVEMAAQNVDLQNFQTRYYKISQIGRNKRKAYMNFLKKYEKFVDVLTKNLYIPCKQAMIQSGTQMNFIGKKDQWQFSKLLALRLDLNEKQKLQKTILPFKLSPLKNEPDIQDFYLKAKVIEFFITAKLQARHISQLKYHGDLQVANLTDLEIEGHKGQNETCAELKTNKLLLAIQSSSKCLQPNVECERQQRLKQLKINFHFGLAKQLADQDQIISEEPQQISGSSSQEIEKQSIEIN